MDSFVKMAWRLVAAAVLISASLPASTIYTGTLQYDNTVIQVPITVLAPSSLRAYTTSYGTNYPLGLGTAGGFDPMLSLYDGSGKLIGFNDDAVGCPAPLQGNPGCWDSNIQMNLAPGSYTLVLAQVDNEPVGIHFGVPADSLNIYLSDGFTMMGAGNRYFTRTTFAPAGTDTGMCYEDGGAQRACNYSLTLDLQSAPEPGTLPALAAGFAGLLWYWKRKR